MDSNALMTRKRAKIICCDLLALVDRGTKNYVIFTCTTYFLSADYNAVSLPMQSFQWDSNNGS